MSTLPSGVGDERPVPVRVVVVTDVRLFREGLAAMLSGHEGIEVVATTGPADGFVTQMVQLQPHLVLVDAALIRCTDVVVRISNLETGARIVAFAVAEEDDREVLACAEAGVAGFVGRDASVNDLVVALHTALRGEVRCSPRVAGLMMRRIAAYSDLGPFAYDRSRLTRREIEIVELIDVGLSNKEIACRLGIETATVKNHVHNLLEKLRVHRRGEAAAAVRVGRRGPTMRPGLDHPT